MVDFLDFILPLFTGIYYLITFDVIKFIYMSFFRWFYYLDGFRLSIEFNLF